MFTQFHFIISFLNDIGLRKVLGFLGGSIYSILYFVQGLLLGIHLFYILFRVLYWGVTVSTGVPSRHAGNIRTHGMWLVTLLYRVMAKWPTRPTAGSGWMVFVFVRFLFVCLCLLMPRLCLNRSEQPSALGSKVQMSLFLGVFVLIF